MSDRYYDTYWENEGWATRPSHELLELFGRHLGPADRCLDVGCGDGGTSGVWLDRHVDAYVGVDVSDSAVRMARERGLDAHRIDDAAALPFAEDSFDVAVCIEVLEHLFQPQLALAEIHRILRPAGRLLVTVPNVGHWRTRADLALLGRWNPRGDRLSVAQPWRDPHVRFFTVRTLSELVRRSGFEVVEAGGQAVYGLGQHVPGLRRLSRTTEAGLTTRRLAAVSPGLLAAHAYAVGRADAYHPPS